MPTPIDWQTPYNDFLTAFNAAPVFRQVIVQQQKQDLEVHGAAYDQERLRLGSQLSDAEGDYAARYAIWSGEATNYGSGWVETDRLVRYLEQLQLDALTGVQLDPKVFTAPDGTKTILVPEVPTPFTGDGDPLATASLALEQSSTAVLRVTALERGTFGNAVKVQVASATSTRINQFNLVVSLGAYTELYEDFDATDVRFKPSVQSLLIESPTLVSFGRPDNISATALAGGAGDARETLERRVNAAMKFTTTLLADKGALNSVFQRAVDKFKRRPAPSSILAKFERDLVVPLTAAIDAANRAREMLEFTPP